MPTPLRCRRLAGGVAAVPARLARDRRRGRSARGRRLRQLRSDRRARLSDSESAIVGSESWCGSWQSAGESHDMPRCDTGTHWQADMASNLTAIGVTVGGAAGITSLSDRPAASQGCHGEEEAHWRARNGGNGFQSDRRRACLWIGQVSQPPSLPAAAAAAWV